MFDNASNLYNATKKALLSGDWSSMLQVSFDSFIKSISKLLERSLSFSEFLDCTSEYLDRFILDTEEHEKLHYIGGKMTVQLKTDNDMSLSADFYFQTDDKKWVQKRKEGKIDTRRIKDWDSDLNLIKLRKGLVLEFPVDRPDDKQDK